MLMLKCIKPVARHGGPPIYDVKPYAIQSSTVVGIADRDSGPELSGTSHTCLRLATRVVHQATDGGTASRCEIVVQ